MQPPAPTGAAPRSRLASRASHYRARAQSRLAAQESDTDLDHRVLVAEELDEARDDAALDDLLDRGVALLAEQLAELGRRVELLVRLVAEDALDHDRELFLELVRVRRDSQRGVRGRAAAGARTAESTPPSSSESAPLSLATRLRLLATLSSRFCLRISTCASSRRRRSSVGAVSNPSHGQKRTGTGETRCDQLGAPRGGLAATDRPVQRCPCSCTHSGASCTGEGGRQTRLGGGEGRSRWAAPTRGENLPGRRRERVGIAVAYVVA